eukprot:gene10145-10303_t
MPGSQAVAGDGDGDGELPACAAAAAGSSGGGGDDVKLYGLWQTQEWQAPAAADGKVPKNERGNVEVPPLTKRLPAGTKHLNFSGLAAICRSLDIDFAPALVGFEVQGGRMVPKIEGVVVCEEFEQAGSSSEDDAGTPKAPLVPFEGRPGKTCPGAPRKGKAPISFFDDLCGHQYHECWLKYLVHPHATKPAREGSDVGWTSGIVGPEAEKVVEEKGEKKVRKYHVVTTAQGAAVHWQVRVHYYWYLKQKAECDKAPDCEMGGFTRLLHSGEADDLMEEIPSFVADPLPEAVVPHEWYPVLNRPYAFVQWVKQANISEEFVLMSEPDHIFLRPIPNFMKRDDWPAAFPFFYIEAHKDENIPIVAKFVPGGKLTKDEAETMAPIGNSPTFLSMAQMRAVMPLWQNLSVAIYKDEEANHKWGWVQEMYAFTISLYIHGVRHVDLILHMELSRDKPYYILHYTYGNDYTLDGKHTPGKYGAWRFDKRTYANKPPPRRLGDPPPLMHNDMVRALISHINEASENIPCWDEYYDTGVKPVNCSEKIPGSVYPGAT